MTHCDVLSRYQPAQIAKTDCQMTRFETWTSVAGNWRTNHAKMTLRDYDLKAAAMDRTRTLHEGAKNTQAVVQNAQ